jgi:hypothetical protein
VVGPPWGPGRAVGLQAPSPIVCSTRVVSTRITAPSPSPFPPPSPTHTHRPGVPLLQTPWQLSHWNSVASDAKLRLRGWALV